MSVRLNLDYMVRIVTWISAEVTYALIVFNESCLYKQFNTGLFFNNN